METDEGDGNTTVDGGVSLRGSFLIDEEGMLSIGDITEIARRVWGEDYNYT